VEDDAMTIFLVENSPILLLNYSKPPRCSDGTGRAVPFVKKGISQSRRLAKHIVKV